MAYAATFRSHRRFKLNTSYLNPQLSAPRAVVVIFYSHIQSKAHFATYACTKEHLMTLNYYQKYTDSHDTFIHARVPRTSNS